MPPASSARCSTRSTPSTPSWGATIRPARRCAPNPPYPRLPRRRPRPCQPASLPATRTRSPEPSRSSPTFATVAPSLPRSTRPRSASFSVGCSRRGRPAPAAPRGGCDHPAGRLSPPRPPPPPPRRVGGPKPTPVNPTNLSRGHRGEAIVALAGPASNLIMAAAAAISIRVIDASPAMQDVIASSDLLVLAFRVLLFFVLINIFLFVFNLL